MSIRSTHNSAQLILLLSVSLGSWAICVTHTNNSRACAANGTYCGDVQPICTELCSAVCTQFIGVIRVNTQTPATTHTIEWPRNSIVLDATRHNQLAVTFERTSGCSTRSSQDVVDIYTTGHSIGSTSTTVVIVLDVATTAVSR